MIIIDASGQVVDKMEDDREPTGFIPSSYRNDNFSVNDSDKHSGTIDLSKKPTSIKSELKNHNFTSQNMTQLTESSSSNNQPQVVTDSVDQPLDLTCTKIKQEDSDTLSNKCNGVLKTMVKSLSETGICSREKIKRQLQEELRNEEALLVLMKKIRHSQLMNENEPVNGLSMKKPIPNQIAKTSDTPPAAHKNSAYNANRQHSLHYQQKQNNTNTQLSQNAPSSLVPHSNAAVNNQPSSKNQGFGHHLSQANTNLVSQISAHYNQNSKESSKIHPAFPAPTLVPPKSEQTAEQKQAAAKMALRKHLEKTLLHIPPPKPPPPEMNFIPSLPENSFLVFVGLNEVVKYITDTSSHGESSDDSQKYIFNPFSCVQCKTDFTPVWKRDRPGSRDVICEQCCTKNQKQALKQAHTNRLKSAFMKALQQEREIEKQLEQEQQREAQNQLKMQQQQDSMLKKKQEQLNEYARQVHRQQQEEFIRKQQQLRHAHSSSFSHQNHSKEKKQYPHKNNHSSNNSQQSPAFHPPSAMNIAGLANFSGKNMMPLPPQYMKNLQQHPHHLLNMLPQSLTNNWGNK